MNFSNSENSLGVNFVAVLIASLSISNVNRSGEK